MTALADTLARLDALVDWERRDRAGMRVDVQPARDLLDRLGRPDRRLRIVHIAGTKGKGSVAALVDAGLRAAGRTAGRYGSPHVERVNERIVIGGAEIGDDALAEALSAALAAQEAATAAGTPGAAASWFDVWTAAAFAAFAEAGVEWAVIECGIGGRLDSTNAADGEIAVLTNVDLEHTALLGDTRAKIARDKLGIVKPGRPLVTGVPRGSEADAVVDEIAATQGSRVHRPAVPEDAPLREINRGTANEVLALAGAPPLSAEAATAVRLPGRMEIVDHAGLTVVLDGAHVPDNLRAVIRDLRREPRFEAPCVVLMGLGADKNLPGLVEALSGLDVHALVATAYRHGAPPHEPAALVEAATSVGLVARAVEPAEAAFDEALAETRALPPGGWLLVTGSLHVVGAVRGQVVSAQAG